MGRQIFWFTVKPLKRRSWRNRSLGGCQSMAVGYTVAPRFDRRERSCSSVVSSRNAGDDSRAAAKRKRSRTKESSEAPARPGIIRRSFRANSNSAAAGFVNSFDQLAGNRMAQEREEPDWRHECDLFSKLRRFAHGQSDARRISHEGITDINDFGQRNSLFVAFVSNNKRVPVVPNFVNEIKQQFLKHESAGDRQHRQRNDNKCRLGAFDRANDRGKQENTNHPKPDDWEHPLVKKCRSGRNSTHPPILLPFRLFFRLGFFRLFGRFRFLGGRLLGFTGPIFLLLGGGKRFLQSDHVFARSKSIESFCFLTQLFLSVVRGFDR